MEANAFRTIFPKDSSKFRISHSDKIFLIGSCFAENIYEKLSQAKFQCIKNPHGIVYHPLAITKSLSEIIQSKNYTEKDLIKHNEIWHSWNHHSIFSSIDKNEVLSKINSSIEKAHQHLKNSKHLIITLGTAWAYQLKENKMWVANCHKYPATTFNKKLLGIEEVKTEFSKLLKLLKTFNPNLNIIFTISPVRHLRDGFRENQWSKSVLQLSVQALQSDYPELNYFPSYELVMDDLRDYRFFEDDMVHPNSVAIDYIWEYFNSFYFDAATMELNKNIHQIVAASLHRPFQPQSDAHQKFIKKTLESIQTLNQKYSFLDFKKETQFLQSQLLN